MLKISFEKTFYTVLYTVLYLAWFQNETQNKIGNNIEVYGTLYSIDIMYHRSIVYIFIEKDEPFGLSIHIYWYLDIRFEFQSRT